MVHTIWNLAYSKGYILYAINMWYDIIVLKSSMSFCDMWLYDCKCDSIMWPVTYVQ